MTPDRTIVFVVGAGRSGTSTITGILRALGHHVPAPEVAPDESNPKGFGEAQWLVDRHDAWLREVLVQVADSRPAAWDHTGRVTRRDQARARATAWLGDQLAVHDHLVVKDPRLGWFLPLWCHAAEANAASARFLSMLRPPAEVVGSRQKYYGSRLGNAHLAASWANMMLHIESATRPGASGSRRAFVRYGDLLTAPWSTTRTAGERLALPWAHAATPEQVAAVERVVDPGLRRVSATLADLDLPVRLHEIVAETWEALGVLADHEDPAPTDDPGGTGTGTDVSATYETLESLRDAYVELYEESEAITRSSVVAAEARGRREANRSATGPAPASSAPETPDVSRRPRWPGGSRRRSRP